MGSRCKYGRTQNVCKVGHPAGSIADLDRAFSVLMKTPGWERFKNTAATGRVKYYLDARGNGISTEKFTTLYGEYRDIDASESLNSTQKAHEWAVVLEDAVDDGYITEKQKDKLKEKMVFRYSFKAETQKFDTMIDAGITRFSATPGEGVSSTG